jgi:hypothetical protein
MKLLGAILALGFAAICARATAAINPEEFKKAATDVVKLREVARIQAPIDDRQPSRQRITIIADVVDVQRASSGNQGLRTLVIDYTVDLAARDAERKAYDKAMRGAAGRQFMYQPDPPTLDANREFWAHLVPAAGRGGEAKAFSGHIARGAAERLSGPVFIPAAGQYTWDAPTQARNDTMNKKKTSDAAESTFTGTLRTGIMAIGGETTGVILETDAGTYELDVRANQDAERKLESLEGKKVVVTGTYAPRPGVEIKQRRIVIVRSIREAR